jgi:hypothetical protein
MKAKVKKNEKFDNLLNQTLCNVVDIDENELGDFVAYAVKKFNEKKNTISAIPKNLVNELVKSLEVDYRLVQIGHGIELRLEIFVYYDETKKNFQFEPNDEGTITFPKEFKGIGDVYIEEVSTAIPAVKEDLDKIVANYLAVVDKIKLFAKENKIKFSTLWEEILNMKQVRPFIF